MRFLEMTAWRKAFERVEPGQSPVEAPEELKTWSIQTAYGFLGGSLFGGYRGLLISRTSEASPLPANNQLHRASMFFVRESLFTGARIGLFVSTFSAFALALHNVRGQEHPANFAAAGGVTCGLFGGAIGGWYGVVQGVLFGGAISGAGALVQEAAKQAANASNVNGSKHLDDPEEKVRQAICNLIERYERNLENRPTISNHKLSNNPGEGSEDGQQPR